MNYSDRVCDPPFRLTNEEELRDTIGHEKWSSRTPLTNTLKAAAV